MDFQHGCDQFGRAAYIADTPARHGEGFREAAYNERALFHAGQRGDADVALPIAQFRIDFIRDDDKVMGNGKLGDRRQVLPRHDSSCRIVRIIQDQYLGTGRKMTPEIPGAQLEPFLFRGLHLYNLASMQLGNGRICDVAWRRYNDLIPRHKCGAKRQIDRLTAAHGHEHFMRRIVA
ncbi:hypothetical protein D3C77_453180 [compost metagenome]